MVDAVGPTNEAAGTTALPAGDGVGGDTQQAAHGGLGEAERQPALAQRFRREHLAGQSALTPAPPPGGGAIDTHYTARIGLGCPTPF